MLAIHAHHRVTLRLALRLPLRLPLGGAAWALGRPGAVGGWSRGRRRLQALVLPLVLVLLLLPGCDRLARSERSGSDRLVPVAPQAPAGRLQESAPPGAVQQLSAALASRNPRVTVLRPAADTVLPAGPWALELTLKDWPLARSEALGLGPHLVVQIDADEPLRISDWGSGDPTTGQLVLEMPPLSPGSHRLSIYAARPWGEAVKQPGASTQLVLHRVAADRLSQPPPRSPQLIAVSPAGLAEAEPVLIDWLLLDAPLQGLRQDDGQWRLRISVNGDSFLVDQNVPLWLSGFHNGSNAVLMELLDGRGEPLNPPFSSAVREVLLDRTAPRPAWLQPRLDGQELAVLLGQAPETETAQQPPVSAEPTEPVEPAEPVERVEPVEPVEPAEPVEPSEPAPRADRRADEPVSSSDQNASREEQNPALEPGAAPLDGVIDATPEPSAHAAAPLADGAGQADDQADGREQAPAAPTSARNLVREDGSMIKPAPRGPLSGLRQRIGS